MDYELIIRGVIVGCAMDNDDKNKVLAYFDNLLEDSNFLNCLEACGVDNWPGYSDAREMLESDED